MFTLTPFCLSVYFFHFSRITLAFNITTVCAWENVLMKYYAYYMTMSSRNGDISE